MLRFLLSKILQEKKFFKKVFLFQFTQFLVSVLNFVVIKILTLKVSSDVVGKFSWIFSAFGFSAFISLLGLGITLQYYVPRKNEIERRQIISSSWTLYQIVFFLFSLILIFLLRFKYKYPFWYIFLLYPVGLSVMLTMTLIALQEITFLFFARVSFFLIWISFLTFSKNLNLTKILFGYFIGSVIGLIIGVYKIGFIPFSFNFGVLKKIWDYWKYALYNSILSPFFNFYDRLIVGYFAPFNEVAYFSVARNIENFFRVSLYSLLAVLSPEVSLRDSKNDKNFKRLTLSAFLVNISLVFISFLIILIFGKFLIKILATSEYVKGYEYLLILGFALLIAGFYAFETLLWRATGKIKKFFLSNLVRTIIYVFLTLILGKFWGIYGICFSTLIANLLTLIYVLRNQEFYFDILRSIWQREIRAEHLQ